MPFNSHQYFSLIFLGAPAFTRGASQCAQQNSLMDISAKLLH
jgi:hypothetical protein